MKYVKGFFMAWGMFCYLPCPYKKWDEAARGGMLAMFPLIGTMIGLIISAVWFVMNHFGCNFLVTGGIMTGLCLVLTGFIHLDGFMDVSDAVMSRRPELEERQRILKDSRVGAFAVICLMVVMMLLTVSMIAIADVFSIAKALAVIVVLTTSRGMSAFCVINKEPMNSSQYKEGCFTKAEAVLTVIIPLIVLAAAIGVIVALFGLNWVDLRTLIIVFAVTALVSRITGRIDRKSLGGMNGDISGHMLTMAETAGLMALALIS